ncbi:preprotein translocase subunit YajC [Rhodococcus phenolicus]|uniref:preprotein translocase subunit YajC n=1 Tax=Rhodococcus phenolicus TaxID=263849 RepID=UPI00082C653E|nr:preprotein translocase subunit YajC [Rhodococcus phenolicus]
MELLFPLLILALLVPTFLGIRRQKKEMQKVTELQDSLHVGDRVTTTAGLHATVAALSDTTVDLEIAPGVVTTWARMVVRERIEEDTTGTDDFPGTGTVSFGKDDDTDPPAGRPVEH